MQGANLNVFYFLNTDLVKSIFCNLQHFRQDLYSKIFVFFVFDLQDFCILCIQGTCVPLVLSLGFSILFEYELLCMLCSFCRKRIFERNETEYEPMPEADRPGGFDFGGIGGDNEGQNNDELNGGDDH